ncbi:MAG: VIT1/CCC1 transporter family protein [Chitinophagaceae bacterium]|nr:VIT1/CCC1 transporter family protein [Chitinophagaceae bacterium]MCW5913091.1 VIT1/CCC1 transporter family protein [Chitinophagaceae bacterium]MCZ2396888.1 VIT1/CCC1 transporter family protein [Chitinophagales bacterium]
MSTRVPAVHKEQHVNSSALIRDVVIGMSDGLTVPFALAAGLTGAVAESSIIVIAGLAEIAAGSIAMGLGGYLAGKTDQDYYLSERRREEKEVETVPEIEKEEVRDFFRSIGLSESTQKVATEEISRDKKQWVDFMMKFELGLETPDPLRARKSALNIGISYAIGGLIPLFPYFLISDSRRAIVYSIIAAAISLFVFGYFKSKSTGVPVISGALKIVLIGATAAASAFIIARLLQ